MRQVPTVGRAERPNSHHRRVLLLQRITRTFEQLHGPPNGLPERLQAEGAFRGMGHGRFPLVGTLVEAESESAGNFLIVFMDNEHGMIVTGDHKKPLNLASPPQSRTSAGDTWKPFVSTLSGCSCVVWSGEG